MRTPATPASPSDPTGAEAYGDELQLARSNLQLALEAGQMGAWSWDMRTNHIAWWPGMARLHGTPPGFVLRDIADYIDFVHPDDRAIVEASLQEAREAHETSRVEYRIVRPDGEVRWLETHARVTFDADGRPLQRSGVCSDITHRKKTERGLRFMTQASSELASLADVGTTLHRVCRLAVPAFADYCAIDILDGTGALQRLAIAHGDPKREQAIGRDLIKRFPPDPNAPSGRWRVMRTGEPVFVPEVTPAMLAAMSGNPELAAALDGMQLRSVIITPLRVRGEAFGVIIFTTAESGRSYAQADLDLAMDLTRRASIAIENDELFRALHDETRTLEQLRASGQAFASTLELDALPQATAEACTQIAGATCGVFVPAGSQAAPAVAGPGAGIAADSLAALARRDRAQGACIVAADLGAGPGDAAVRSYLAMPVVSKTGDVHGMLALAHTEPGRFNERTRKLVAAIAVQAAAAIDNAQLYRTAQDVAAERERMAECERASREEAERASRLKDEFLAMLAHELRNPLAPVGSAAQLLARIAPDHEQVRRCVDVINRQVRHMTQLVDDLLDVSRVTRGLVTIRCEGVDLAAVVQEAREQVRPLIEPQRHRLAVRLPDGPVHVQGDATRLTQVVANLLNNAAKYTPAGGDITVELALAPGACRLSVRDNGVGIAADLLPKVFDLFTQGQRSLDRSQGGLGVGLALVKRLVDMHGGSVAVESAGPGQGTHAWVSLPLASAPDKRPAAGASGTAGPAAAGTKAEGGLSVLVVDDNADAANVLAMVLRHDGHAVQVEYAPAPALARAVRERPDVLLIDIGLPEIDGYELARRLRREPALDKAVLVALTGYGQPADIALAMDAGFTHHLLKPMQPDDLRRILHEAGKAAGKAAGMALG